jgi:hypothetical protein
VFYPLAGPEAYVKQGMKIGYVTDYFGSKGCAGSIGNSGKS